ncbi:MAG: hypothetical protein SGCHY_005155, partial [Lobulomycetales sp.]
MDLLADAQRKNGDQPLTLSQIDRLTDLVKSRLANKNRQATELLDRLSPYTKSLEEFQEQARKLEHLEHTRATISKIHAVDAALTRVRDIHQFTEMHDSFNAAFHKLDYTKSLRILDAFTSALGTSAAPVVDLGDPVLATEIEQAWDILNSKLRDMRDSLEAIISHILSACLSFSPALSTSSPPHAYELTLDTTDGSLLALAAALKGASPGQQDWLRQQFLDPLFLDPFSKRVAEKFLIPIIKTADATLAQVESEGDWGDQEEVEGELALRFSKSATSSWSVDTLIDSLFPLIKATTDFLDEHIFPSAYAPASQMLYTLVSPELAIVVRKLVPFALRDLPGFLARLGPAFRDFMGSLNIDPTYTVLHECLSLPREAGFTTADEITAACASATLSFINLKRLKLYETIRRLWKHESYDFIDLSEMAEIESQTPIVVRVASDDASERRTISIPFTRDDLAYDLDTRDGLGWPTPRVNEAPYVSRIFSAWNEVATMFASGKVSQRMYTFRELLTSLVCELEVIDRDDAKRHGLEAEIVATARSCLKYYYALLCTPANMRSLETDISRAMVLHNDCLWIGHWCLVTGACIQDRVRENQNEPEEGKLKDRKVPSDEFGGWDDADAMPEELDDRLSALNAENVKLIPAFIDMACMYHSLGQKVCNKQIELHLRDAREIRAEAGDIRAIDGISDQGFGRVEAVYQRVVFHTQHVLQTWMKVLPTRVYLRVSGIFYGRLLKDLNDEVIGLLDIGADESHKLHLLMEMLSASCERMFADASLDQHGRKHIPPARPVFPSELKSRNENVNAHVAGFQKYRELSELLELSLADISARLESGRYYLDFSKEEKSRMIRALFSD